MICAGIICLHFSCLWPLHCSIKAQQVLPMRIMAKSVAQRLCTHVCTQTHKHTCTNTRTHIKHTLGHMHARTSTYAHAGTRAHAHAHTHACTDAESDNKLSVYSHAPEAVFMRTLLNESPWLLIWMLQCSAENLRSFRTLFENWMSWRRIVGDRWKGSCHETLSV